MLKLLELLLLYIFILLSKTSDSAADFRCFPTLINIGKGEFSTLYFTCSI